MTAAAESKPLSTFEQKLLTALLERLKPRIDELVFDAKIKVKAKLRETLGDDGCARISDVLGRAQLIATQGEIVIAVPAPACKVLAAIVDAGTWLGLPPTPKS